MIWKLKTLGGELSPEEKNLLRKKFLNLDKILPANAILTVGVKLHITKKSDQAYEIVFHAQIPGLKKHTYFKVFKNNFIEAADIARDRADRILTKRLKKDQKRKGLSNILFFLKRK